MVSNYTEASPPHIHPGLYSSYVSCFTKSKHGETESDNIYLDYFLHLSSAKWGAQSSLRPRNELSLDVRAGMTIFSSALAMARDQRIC